MNFPSKSGSFTPLGSSPTESGVNFAVVSHHATQVTLRLFEDNGEDPFATFPLNRSGDTWHIEVENLPETFEYTFRCDGPYEPKKGYLFNPEMDLTDPYARALNVSAQWGQIHRPIRSRYAPPKPFDWEHISRPMIPQEELVIYEMHVRSFTQHPSSGVAEPGTFRGIIEKIPHLKSLGVNAIELMPIHEFPETENLKRNPLTQEKLFNYWGYSTSNFFCPMRRYGTAEDFKSLVKELHREGIEVFLDVVYNHTSEGSDPNAYFSFRGIDNATYYIVDEKGYHNYTGCGNTLKCQHPTVQDLILDSLRYFVSEFHIDGFRFDLASILTRSETGQPLENPYLIERITQDPILAPTKLIAEPWDPAGLYQVGSFPSWKFAEWNGKYRDEVRRFMKGDGNTEAMKQCLLGSPHLYSTPLKSVNFMTVHDGFTLRDLVSYHEKHNEENGEQNRDGANDNESWNCGTEGETDDPAILALRERQMRNFLFALFVSQGTPMFLMGDEYGHTRNGNNNAWCQDNERNYFLWDQNSSLFPFIQTLITLRQNTPLLRQKTFPQEIAWEEEGYLGLTLNDTLFIAFNPTKASYSLQKPGWSCCIDTSLPELKHPTPIHSFYELKPYTSVFFRKNTAI